MTLDIFIIVVIGLAQLVSTIYGVVVALADQKVKAASVIGTLGLIALAFTVWGASRSSDAQEKLQTQLDRIEKKPEPIPIVNVPAPIVNFPQVPQHTHVEIPVPSKLKGNPPVGPFHENDAPEFNVLVVNAGDYPINSESTATLFALINVSDIANGFKEYRSNLRFGMPGGAINPHQPYNYVYSTVKAGPFTAAEAGDLNHHSKVLCAIGAVIWNDGSGKYETDLYDCYLDEGDGTYNWHRFRESDRELKIK